MSAAVSDTPFFSIIIPTYNSAKCIQTVLASIAAQEFTGYEIVVQDGLSTDSTISIIGNFQQTHPAIAVNIASGKDLGIYDAMNKAIDRARGQYLLFLGSDDKLYGNKVLLSVYDQIRHLDADMIYGNVQVAGSVGWAGDGATYDGEFTKEKLFYRNICHQAVFYKRTVFDKIGKFNIKYKICADWDMNHRCFAKAATTYIPETIAWFYSGGESTRQSHDAFTDYDLVINLHRYYGAGYFGRLFKGYVWVFMNVAGMKWANKKYFSSFYYFIIALYHSPSKISTIRNYLVNILINIRSKSIKSSHS